MRPRQTVGPSWTYQSGHTVQGLVPYYWLGQANTNWATVEAFETAVTADPDGDGFTTGEEYWSGTDPFNATSFLHISSVAASAGNIRLIWEHAHVDSSIPPICIQMRLDLVAGSWLNVTNVSPMNGTNTWDDTTLGKRYYRLCVPSIP